MPSTSDFIRQHTELRKYLEEGDFETFGRELRAHGRQEERALFCWLRPLLDAMASPWVERSCLWNELLEPAGQAECLAAFDRLVRLEEEVLFPLAMRLDPSQ